MSRLMTLFAVLSFAGVLGACSPTTPSPQSPSPNTTVSPSPNTTGSPSPSPRTSP